MSSDFDKIVSGSAENDTARPVPAIGVKVGPFYVAATKFPLLSLISMLRLDVALAYPGRVRELILIMPCS